MKVLTEGDLRAARLSTNLKEYHVARDVLITPAAREYLTDLKIALVVDQEDIKEKKVSQKEVMTQRPTPQSGKRRFVDAVTGQEYETKSEDMTHLRENLLVKKTHPRIALRGQLDKLQARVLLLQARFPEDTEIYEELDSVLNYVAQILAAEVKNIVLEETPLFGLTEEEIHHRSHDVQKYFGIPHLIPKATMGFEALELNLLRTEVREAELAAAEAFLSGDSLGIVRHLNRLSSGIYILFCKVVSRNYR